MDEIVVIITWQHDNIINYNIRIDSIVKDKKQNFMLAC